MSNGNPSLELPFSMNHRHDGGDQEGKYELKSPGLTYIERGDVDWSIHLALLSEPTCPSPDSSENSIMSVISQQLKFSCNLL